MVKLRISAKSTIPTISKGEVVIKTCNRSETYGGEGEIPQSVVTHLFRVVSGLESNLVGEKAIQGQVKDAYLYASDNNLSSSMHMLFQRALYVGKKVRTNTGINRGAVSHSQAAVDLLINSNISLGNRKITLIGAHNMNQKIIAYLLKKGAKTIFLGNRTFHKAESMAKEIGSEAFTLDKLSEQLIDTDILISATSAPHYIVTNKNYPSGKKMTIIDLALPSDVDPSIVDKEPVKYITIDHVEDSVNINLEKRSLELKKASMIVESEIEIFMNNQAERLGRSV